MGLKQLSKRLDRLEEDIPPSYIPLWCDALQAAREGDRAALEAVKAKLSTWDKETEGTIFGAEFVGRYIEAAEATFFAS
jgi:hypothetical protein